MTAAISTPASSKSPTILVTITPWSYLVILTICLALHLACLILPRGFRAHYCPTRRRHRRARKLWQKSIRKRDREWRYTDAMRDGVFGNFSSSCGTHDEDRSIQLDIAALTTPHLVIRGPTQFSTGQYSTRTTLEPDSNPLLENSNAMNKDRTFMSDVRIVDKTATPIGAEYNPFLSNMRQQMSASPGIKMIAHGTKCNPRLVCVTLHFHESSSKLIDSTIEHSNCLTWRAALRPSSTSNNVPKLGNVRKIAYHDILGIIRGKQTIALRRVQTAQHVDEDSCFSLLTKSGSLDLECDGRDVREGFIRILGDAMISNQLEWNMERY